MMDDDLDLNTFMHGAPADVEETVRAGSPIADPANTRIASEEEVIEALRTVYDPEIPVNIFELGLIYERKIEADGSVKITMTLTAPACPVAGILPQQVADAVAAVPGVGEVEVELVWDPPWEPGRMSEDAKMALGFF